LENDFWLNLPSNNLEKAKIFYTGIGCKLNDKHAAPHLVSLYVGNKNIVLNLFSENVFKQFSQSSTTNTKISVEIMFSLGASSPSEVDTLAKQVTASGGQVFAQPGWKDGWMYGCGFCDPDGHRWSALFMDISKLPKG
jgi:predicted lactoylglutathione lyase